VIGLSAETLNVAEKVPLASARYVLPYILPLVGVMKTPLELKLWPAGDEPPVVLHLRPEPTAGERYWLERIARGEARAPWADLRWDDRVVLGGVG
jgi:hypothetical protein